MPSDSLRLSRPAPHKAGDVRLIDGTMFEEQAHHGADVSHVHADRTDLTRQPNQLTQIRLRQGHLMDACAQSGRPSQPVAAGPRRQPR